MTATKTRSAKKAPARAERTALPIDVAIDARTLTTAINNVALFAGLDETLPVLCAIHLELESGQLVLAATDRYRLASEQVPVSGRHRRCKFLLSLHDAKKIAARFTPPKPKSSDLVGTQNPPVMLTFDGTKLTVGNDSETVNLTAVPGKYPDWRKLLDDARQRVDAPKRGAAKPQKVALNPDFLADFTKVKTDDSIVPMLVTVVGDALPVIVERGTRFVGMQMPVRLSTYSTPAPTARTNGAAKKTTTKKTAPARPRSKGPSR